MFKRLFAMIVIAAALAACSPAGGGSSEPSVDTLPSESVEASPSAS